MINGFRDNIYIYITFNGLMIKRKKNHFWIGSVRFSDPVFLPSPKKKKEREGAK